MTFPKSLVGNAIALNLCHGESVDILVVRFNPFAGIKSPDCKYDKKYLHAFFFFQFTLLLDVFRRVAAFPLLDLHCAMVGLQAG